MDVILTASWSCAQLVYHRAAARVMAQPYDERHRVMNGTELHRPTDRSSDFGYKKLMFIKDDWPDAPYSNASIRI
jgi:hypothetical protein